MDKNQAIEFDKMEKFIMTDLSELFVEMDQRIINSNFSDEIKKEMRGKMAFGICQH